jgi:hypothetical protein
MFEIIIGEPLTLEDSLVVEAFQFFQFIDLTIPNSFKFVLDLGLILNIF